MDKVALITGASRGIGREIAISLAQDGYDVVINYNGSLEKALETEKMCREYGVETYIYQCNVADYTAVENMIKDIVEKFGRIDVLVNNSGITKDGLMLRMSEDNFDSVIDINLKGTFNLIKNVSRVMFKQKSGNIINLTSVVGIVGNAGQANYSASKAGVIGLTKSIAKEFVSFNVRCNAVAPGFIESDMTDKIPEKEKEKILSSIPMKKMGTPKDIANVVSFLANEKSKYITGQVINVDGGMVM